MRLPNKLSVAATVLGLGGLTGVAMSAGAGKRDRAATPAAEIRTVEIQQTVHRYRHVGAGGSANGAAVGGRVLASYGTGAGKVQTRASGHKASAGATHSSTGVKTGPSGKSGTHKSSKGTSRTAPKTRSSGTTTKHESSTHSPSSGNPTTKPSGAAAEAPTSTSQAPTAPPTTKPSGSTGEMPSGGGTETTPPPTTKPSGSGGETGGGKGGEREHHDD